MGYSILFATCPNFKSAKKISKNLLNKKIVACVNILPIIKSEYWWRGKIESHSEVLMIMKTKTNLYKQVEKEVKKMHSYTIPEIISFKIDKGNKDYLDWISSVMK
ncbi:MAG: divalent-cation tolerance protein CutA [Candidatus Aenigmatarchaeota archaeon]|nr:divalent-cation tolerance protein CutA [Candidatus Aenigmarchaeota archaeon]